MPLMEDFGRMWRRIHEDTEYAWGWHSTIVVSLLDDDPTLAHLRANEMSAKIMKAVFGHDITQSVHWKETFSG